MFKTSSTDAEAVYCSRRGEESVRAISTTTEEEATSHSILRTEVTDDLGTVLSFPSETGEREIIELVPGDLLGEKVITAS